ncbi:hypothetical protein AMATHDRAFT_88361 [Amanita thiersii Skay4041]|uniref:G-protein coupled receptors family 1 profile domain-containing protein n=1 Tax=Amanita thiersii Skay4041 TaxID=703135 RepID=A0A2A9N805_9AGAR|nr:hypothetical protein AMATHDRAFT_88361 [Amanita thiersii Skay4041]
MISVNGAFVSGTFVQSLLYGLYIASTVHSLRWLLFVDEGWRLRDVRAIKWPMLAVSSLLFFFTTADLLLTILQTLSVAIRGAKGFHTPWNTATISIEKWTIITADSVLVLIIIFPMLMCIGDVICSIIYTRWSVLRDRGSSKLPIQLGHIQDVFYACTIALNIYATSAITFKIWLVTRFSAQAGRRLRLTMRIVAESGLLYTLTSILLLLSLIPGIGGLGDSVIIFQALSDAINFSMIGIAFNLIIIRVAQQRAEEEGASSMNPMESMSTMHFGTPGVQRNPSHREQNCPMRQATSSLKDFSEKGPEQDQKDEILLDRVD